MKNYILLFSGLILSFAVSAKSITPEIVIAYIDSKGTQSAREQYFSCWETDKAIGYKYVEEGSGPWLRIAAHLVSDSDGCYTHNLQSAIAMAQIKNPVEVLSMVDSGKKMEAENICVPFMTDETDKSKLLAQIVILEKIENSISKVKSKKATSKRDRCLNIVRSNKKYLQEKMQDKSVTN